MDNKLSLNSLCSGYDKKIVVDNLDINIKSGEIVVLIGPNGCGKSTVLKTITKQLKKLSGCIFIGNEDTDKMKNADMAKHLSMVMTESIKPELMTAREVVSTGRYPYTGKFGILNKEDWEEVDKAIKLLNAEDIKDQLFTKISDGQRQRIMLARAICQKPDVLILDEPTSYLDMRFKLDILTEVKRLAKEENMAIVMSLHELDLVKQIADTILCIENEKAVRIGNVNDIFSGDYIHRLYNVPFNNFDTKTGLINLDFRRHIPAPEFVLPGDIEKRSFEIITEELSYMGISLDENEAPVTKRVIHTSADFDYAKTMTYSENAIDIARDLLKNGAVIVTDTNMTKAGINKSAIAKYGVNVECFMADEDVAREAKERNVTRATVSMERASKLGNNVIFAIGNAPTALIALHEMMEKGMYKPAFVIGVPVGFVNVEAAKELFIGSDVPYIINRGRKGGSNIAAAICNALLYGI